jgi:hypothetical protein
MTALRQKILEDMQLHGLAARTQGSYPRVVRQLAVHYHKPPDQINEDELRLAKLVSPFSLLEEYQAPVTQRPCFRFSHIRKCASKKHFHLISGLLYLAFWMYNLYISADWMAGLTRQPALNPK